MNQTLSVPVGLLASAALLACGSTADNGGPAPVADVGPRTGAETCPPADADIGLDLGQIIPNVDLMECDGTPVEMHDLCPRKAAYFFVYADW